MDWKTISEWIKKLIDKWFKKEEPEPTDPFAAEKKLESYNNFTNYATPVKRLTITKITKDVVYVNHETTPWPDKNGCNSEAHLFVYRDNKWQGGKFDHARAQQSSRDFKNVYGGYGCWKSIGAPKSGEKIALIYIAYDHKERTFAGFVNWP